MGGLKMTPEAFAEVPIPARPTKPRQSGLTMMADWGLGRSAQADLLDIAAPYVDLAKVAVGISRLLQGDVLRDKIQLYEQHDIIPFPGGQFLEYAVHHGQTQAYLAGARAAGYGWIEVSDNVIELTLQQKTSLIRRARQEFGLEVLGEVGSKVQGTSSQKLISDIQACLDAGAWKVFVEAAELFGDDLHEDLIEEITAAVPLEKLVFEAPGPWIPGIRRCDQHATRAWLLRRFGSQVNLANVPPEDILEVETMRRGIGVAALKW
jgi:phosphosulfolactate synthase